MAQASRIGLSYGDFWEMTLSEFSAWQYGWSLREEDEWRRFRVMYALHYNINVKPEHNRTPVQLIPLPSDTLNEESIAIPNLDERMRLAEQYKGKKDVKVTAQQFANEFAL